MVVMEPKSPFRRASPEFAWARSCRTIGTLASQLAMTELLMISINTTDIVMMGHLGPRDLAAGNLAGSFLLLFFQFAVGVLAGVPALVSRELGADRRDSVRRIVLEGLRWGLLLSIPTVVVILLAGPIFVLFGQQPSVAAHAGDYLKYMAIGVLPSFLIITFRGFLSTVQLTHVLLLVQFLGFLLNILLNYTLMFGNFGAPRLGLAGAGISSSAVQWMMCLVLAVFIARSRRVKPFRVFARPWHLDRARFLDVFIVGAPIGVMLVLGLSILTFVVFLAGRMGVLQLSAHAIAMQWCVIVLMLSSGIGQAATITVGRMIGQGDSLGEMRSVQIILGIGFSILLANWTVFSIWPQALVGSFIGNGDPRVAEVVRLAVAIFPVAALFQMANGANAVLIGILNARKHASIAMKASIFAYWAVGLPLCALLGFTFEMGLVGVWQGLAVSFALVTAMLAMRTYSGSHHTPAPISA